jgi:hypothetical protein
MQRLHQLRTLVVLAALDFAGADDSRASKVTKSSIVFF